MTVKELIKELEELPDIWKDKRVTDGECQEILYVYLSEYNDCVSLFSEN